jgi:type II secretory pathway pseudopilin PulG
MADKKQPAIICSWAAILAILFALALAMLVGEPAQLSMALKAQAGIAITQIQTACLNYYTEYSTPPESSENYRLIKILCGDNPRRIAFLSVMPRDLNPNGEMIDSWGTPFRITFDSDNKVRVISAGPDKIFGAADDITSQ